mgnify:CR=1 FL=1
MGNGNDKRDEVVIREVDNGNTDGTRGSNQSGSSTNATTKRGTGRGNTTGSGTTGRGSTKTEQEKDVLGLSVLDEKERKRLERNEKRRQRYHEQKAKGELPSQKKPRKVNNTKKAAKKDDAIDTTQMNIIIKTISSLIAARPNCSHWMLTDAEIQSITTPLAKMMEESEIFNKIGEHSNQIALVTACVTVFVPRIIQTTMIVKENKKHVRQVREQGNKGKVVELNRQHDTDNRNANDGKNNGSDEHWTSSLIY